MQRLGLLYILAGVCAMLNSCTFINDTFGAYRAHETFDELCTDSTYTDDVNEMPVTSNGTHFISLGSNLADKHVTNIYDVFDSINIIRLETKRECAIGYVDKISIVDDNIFVQDSHVACAILRFGMDGKFLNRVGAIGNGPGEVADITDSFVSDSSILVLDQYQNKVARFAFDGSLLEEVKTPFFALQVAEKDGHYVFRGMNSQNYHLGDLVDHYLWTCDKKMNVICKGYHMDHTKHLRMITSNGLTSNDGILSFCDITSDTIYSVTPNGLNKDFVFSFDGRAPRKEALGHDYKKASRLSRENKFFRMDYYAPTANHLFYCVSSCDIRHFVFDKTKGKNTEISFVGTDGNDNHAARIPDLYCSYKGKYVGAVDMGYFMDSEDIDKWITDVPQDHYVRKIFEGGHADDNPVIVIMNPKK